jgi:hypothetical protein
LRWSVADAPGAAAITRGPAIEPAATPFYPGTILQFPAEVVLMTATSRIIAMKLCTVARVV